MEAVYTKVHDERDSLMHNHILGNRNFLIVLISFLICIVFLSSIARAGLKKNSFIGEIITKFSQDGSYLTLLKDFSFIDKAGKRWTANQSLATDGASIPKIFWSVFGSPLRGKYVKAAVIHDQYCVTRIEPWESVHKMFHEALLAAGVDKIKAKIMYAAVYLGGPRWNEITVQSARSFFNKNFINENNDPDFKGFHHPPIERFKVGTMLYELCVIGSCSWTELNEFEDRWVSDYIRINTKPTMNSIDEEQKDMVVDFITNKNPNLSEIEEYLNSELVK